MTVESAVLTLPRVNFNRMMQAYRPFATVIQLNLVGCHGEHAQDGKLGTPI